ncbi:hypothetical protein HGO38_01415 [Rhizobium sp. CG5]|uniref:hypothetical protein n=1 Tax=Rhizobium sp. CG5 TaxID=2726076 RepID=UPI002034873C|nr:hypothetical protein [Rhizobium sp. CG5]MCM2472134.1 hypothetical protein [Rhizobium sp. CG5]
MTLIVTEVSELVFAIERARAMYDQGDVQDALMLSTTVYEQAKAAALAATKVKASRKLIDKARRMQADALKIESLCYVAMADVVDEAQAKGQIARRGRPKNISDENVFTFEDVGLDPGHLHQARQLRNAERAEPGFIERAVEARIDEGFEPSRASLKQAAGHAIGTKSATKEDRGDDLYETPIEAMRTLLALESFSAAVKEPSVGRGAILRPLEDAGYDVVISDLVDRGTATRHGECHAVGDFLTSQPGETLGLDIVTNPPFGIANAYIAHALKAHQPRKMAMLLNFNFAAGFDDADRVFVMETCPPSRIYLFSRRLPMMHRDGWQGNKASSQMNTAWFVWERNDDGSYGEGYPKLIRVDWERFKTAEPLLPGAGGHVGPMLFANDLDEDFTRETPRKTIDERVSEELHRAIAWVGQHQDFDMPSFRRGVAVRTLVANALIDDMVASGIIEPRGDGTWFLTAQGIHYLANGWAADAVNAAKRQTVGEVAA